MDSNEMSLREHLLAAQAAGQAQSHSYSNPSPHHDHIRPAGSGSPPDQIDPAIAGALQASGYGLGGHDSGSEGMTPEGRKGNKRELSTSKRAAQNRAAQRAFRQRKEGYIKKLEEENRQMQALNESFKQIQAENYQLRDYVISLQSRLIESQGDYPQPPLDLRDPRNAEHIHHTSAPTATMGSSAVSQLQAAAAAAAAGELERAKQEQQQQAHQQETEPPEDESVIGDSSATDNQNQYNSVQEGFQGKRQRPMSAESEHIQGMSDPINSMLIAVGPR